VNCPKCKTEISPKDTVCPKCKLRLVFECPRCKSQIKIGSSSCKKCGFVFVKFCPECNSANYVSTTHCRKCFYHFKEDEEALENIQIQNIQTQNIQPKESKKEPVIKKEPEIKNAPAAPAPSSRLDVFVDFLTLKNVFEKIRNFDYKRAIIVKKFFDDMKKNLISVYDKLNNNGYYIVVIGDSRIRKVKVESSKIISEIAVKLGFELELEFSYIIQNPYINIPRKGKGGKISIDNVIVLKKGVK